MSFLSPNGCTWSLSTNQRLPFKFPSPSELPKLSSGRNYAAWALQMTALLTLYGLWTTIEENRPVPLHLEILKSYPIYTTTTSLLVLSFHESIASYFGGYKDPKDLWLAVQAYFENEQEAYPGYDLNDGLHIYFEGGDMFRLRELLYQTTLIDFSTAFDYVVATQTLVDKLQLCGPAGRASNGEHVWFLLGGLPNNDVWNRFVRTLPEAVTGKGEVNVVISCMIKYDQTMRLGDEYVDAPVYAVLAKKTKAKRRGTRGKVRCFLCNKRGHKKDQCVSLMQKELEAGEASWNVDSDWPSEKDNDIYHEGNSKCDGAHFKGKQGFDPIWPFLKVNDTEGGGEDTRDDVRSDHNGEPVPHLVEDCYKLPNQSLQSPVVGELEESNLFKRAICEDRGSKKATIEEVDVADESEEETSSETWTEVDEQL